ncbi:MAG: 30S ribosome-binding factor RbfA [Bacilli bacterium]|jgi:ribosome-binding factor A|nr:30S ribosome-binding factor RbfA [Bacilli bacterium]
MKVKTARLATNLHKEISDIVANKLRDEDLKMVTITHVKLSSDLSFAKVYFTTLFGDKKEEVIKDLNKAEHFIKSELCKRKLAIRKIPELKFIYDESIEHGHKIETIIKKLHE